MPSHLASNPVNPAAPTDQAHNAVRNCVTKLAANSAMSPAIVVATTPARDNAVVHQTNKPCSQASGSTALSVEKASTGETPSTVTCELTRGIVSIDIVNIDVVRATRRSTLPAF